MTVAKVSPEADNFFTATPPVIGTVLKYTIDQASGAAAIVNLAGASAYGTKIIGKYVELWASQAIVWAVSGASGAAVSAASGAFGGTSGKTLQAGERTWFQVPKNGIWIYAVAAGTPSAAFEIVQSSAMNRTDFEAGL